MQKKRNKLQRCKSKVTFLAYLDTHPWLQNETYYWTGDRKIKCQVCDKIIPTASKMKQHSKGIKHKKKLVDHHKSRVLRSVKELSILPKCLDAISLSIQNDGTLDNVKTNRDNKKDDMIENEETYLKEFNVIDECFNWIVNDVSEIDRVLGIMNEDKQVDKARVDKAQGKQIHKMKSSVSVQVPIHLFADGQVENIKDYVNSVESIVTNICNNINVGEVHSVLDILNEEEWVDKARVDKAEAKWIQEMKSSVSVQVPIRLFLLMVKGKI